MTSYPAGGMVSNHLQNSKFYNRSQAKIIAEAHYKMGYDLYESIVPLIQSGNYKNEDICKMWPAFVNIAFSCEIILKLFYENDHGEMAHGHKLYTKLFDKLSDASKKIISDITINNMIVRGYDNYNYDDFKDDLKKSENTFEYERYVFEIIPGNSHSLQNAFLLSFAEGLNRLAKQMQ